MGYVPAPAAPVLNLDRFGMPRDYATYCWLLYGKRVDDRSPQRLAFLQDGSRSDGWGASYPGRPQWPDRPSTIQPERR